MTNTILSVKQLSWQQQQKLILDKLTFDINHQSITAIVGPNGAGKTSLLRCIYRQIQNYSGQISFFDQPLNHYKAKQLAQKIAVVNQHLPLSFSLSVSDIVTMGLLPHLSFFSQVSQAQKQLVAKILVELDLDQFSHRPFQALSGGEQQRVLIARALVQQPSLLILDEPTNHLDIHFQHQILAQISQLGITVLMTVHDLNLAACYADQILLLNQGQLIAKGSPEQVLTSQLIQQVFNLPTKLGQNPLSGKQHVYFSAPRNQLEPVI